jgi:uncharacterized repeat protein (TIGR03803 family)
MDAHGNIFGTEYRNVFELVPNGSGGWNPKVIYNFTNPFKQGINPNGTPVLDSAGNIYGTTYGGGPGGDGVAYELSPGKKGWTEKILQAFGKQNSHPLAGLVFDSAGNLYGTTSEGGRFGAGTVFELKADGSGGYKYEVRLAFTGEDGNDAYASMIWDSGYLYGTTYIGGSSGDGTVFAVNPNAAVTTITLTSSPNPSNYGQTVTFTARVTPAPPDGEMIIFEMIGEGQLHGGKAVFKTSTLPVGKTKVRAIYFGDLNFYPSRSIWHYQEVE